MVSYSIQAFIFKGSESYHSPQIASWQSDLSLPYIIL